MSRFPGHIIKLPANTPSQSSAPGVWTLKDQLVAQRNNQWPFQRDPDFRYTTLLLQGNVPNTTGPQAMNLPLAYNSDASSNNFLITPNGDVHPKPFSPYGGSNYSGYFDGASDYVTLPSSADFSFGTADFTIEGWVHPTSWIGGSGVLQIGTTAFPSSVSNSVAFGLDGTPANSFQIYAKNAQHLSAGGYSPNTWHHFALVRSSSTTRLYINGRVAITVLSDTTNYTGTVLGFGAIYGTANFYTGYVSNVRVLKGTAAYTSDFTPAITPFPSSTTNQVLLAFASNRFIDSNTATTAKTLNVNGDVRVTDNSPFVSADFTTGSGYFDGTGDYLSAPNNSAFDLSTADFCVGLWIYLPTGSVFRRVLQWQNGSAQNSNYGWVLHIETTNQATLRLYSGTTGYVTSNSASPLVPGAWNWVVATRSGTAINVYVNGTGASGSGPATINNPAGSVLYISGDLGASDPFLGYLSNLHIVKGSSTAISSANPSLPLTPVSGTSLLTLQTRAPATNNGFIDSSPNNFVVTRNGNATQGSFSPFSPTGWSNFLDGSTAYFTAAANSAINDFGTGDFNIECWFYATSSNFAIEPSLLSCVVTWASSVGYQFEIRSGGIVYFFAADNNQIQINSGATTVSVNTWNHVAVSRSSGTTRLFVNGTQVSSTNAVATISKPSTPVQIGAFSTGVQKFTGYLSNVRIVKGQALYTGNFTPPTAALTTTSVGTSGANVATSVTGTVGLLTCQSNRFKDNSPNNFTLTVNGSPSVQAFSPFAPANSVSPLVTGGSGYFPSSATLTIPSAPALNLVGDFCMEGWAYPTATGFTFAWKYTGGNVGASEYWWVIDGTNQLSIALDGGGGEDYFRTAANTITLNAWNHCVLTRVGNEVRQFINGVLQSYNTTSRTLNATSTTFQTNGTLGYTSGFRIMKGSIPDAYRTTATTTGTTVFTPPTAPPVATQNTSLLLNFTGGGIVDATGKNVIETFGNAQLTTAQPKWTGQGSLSNNGAAGARFQVSSNSAPPLFNVGTGDYTVEFWVNTGTPASQQCILDFRNADVAGQGYALIFNTSRQIIMYYNVGNRITTSAISANVWTHIAVVRYNGVYTIYVNGSASGGTYNNSDAVAPPANRPLIGSVSDGSQVFNGNFSDFRISRIARYTGNFNINTIPGPFPIG